MKFSTATTAFTMAAAASTTTTTNAFSASGMMKSRRNNAAATTLRETASLVNVELPSIESQIAYQPGAADTDFARRFGGSEYVNANIRTVGEAFTDFTEEYGLTVNALYKNMVTDIVGTTHLNVVNARFKRDAVWSLGILTALDLLLKNYPEPGQYEKISSALLKSCDLDEESIRSDAKMLEEWVEGKSRAEIEEALSGNGPEGNPLGQIQAQVKSDEFWMYSRYFGIGLVKIMESVGVEMDKDEVYPVMEDWMSNRLGKSHLTACSDSDLFFKTREKLDMMETMMKEIEIREKKRMADRLEKKAEAALAAVEREEKMQKEIEAEAEKNRERVAASE